MLTPSLHLFYWPVRLPHHSAIRPGPNIDSAVLSQATCSLSVILIMEDLRIKKKKTDSSQPWSAELVCSVFLFTLSLSLSRTCFNSSQSVHPQLFYPFVVSEQTSPTIQISSLNESQRLWLPNLLCI